MVLLDQGVRTWGGVRLALASEKIQAALGGANVRTVTVRAPKIVNIVPA